MNPTKNPDTDCVIVGAGFTGLAAAYFLAKEGRGVTVVEAEQVPGGLAGVFEFADGTQVEKFYHHWFKSDNEVLELISELGLMHKVKFTPSHTGSFINGRVWRLSKPSDLLWFRELSPLERIRLGLTVLYARTVRDTKKLENLSIRQWLEPLVGHHTFRVVWEPLLMSKFGKFADEIAASWMWKKLALRGHSRDRGGNEILAYFSGGFGALIDALVQRCESLGVQFIFESPVVDINSSSMDEVFVHTEDGVVIKSRTALLATPLPIAAGIIGENSILPSRRSGTIPHLSNICLVLRLSRNLGETYWLNVNDPGFPFVGVIEHTNLDTSVNYGDSHIIYLSRYLDSEDPIWDLTDEEYFKYAMPYLKKIFPAFEIAWVDDYRLWRAQYAQPITSRNYSDIVPSFETAQPNVFLQTMAQIYPEDRGTNYAVRDGRDAAKKIIKALSST